YYHRMRYYDPELGRFLSEDPIGLAGGINPYLHAANDPANLRDPSGLQAECPEHSRGWDPWASHCEGIPIYGVTVYGGRDTWESDFLAWVSKTYGGGFSLSPAAQEYAAGWLEANTTAIGAALGFIGGGGSGTALALATRGVGAAAIPAGAWA